MAESIFLWAIGAALGLIAWAEHLFLRDARTVTAHVRRQFVSYHRVESEVLDDRDQELGKKLNVQLDPATSDGRVGDVTVPADFWHASPEGSMVDILALPRRPAWLRWSPMIRYRHRTLWFRLSAGLSVGAILLGLLAL